MENLKSKVAFYLNDSESTIGKIVDLILLGFNLLACTIFVVNCYVDDDILIMDIAEYSILVVFTVEYVLRVWTAKRRREYVLSFYGMIDLVSILPMIFTFEQFNFLRVLKVLRVLRFLRFLESDTFFSDASARCSSRCQGRFSRDSLFSSFFQASSSMRNRMLRMPKSKPSVKPSTIASLP